MGLRGGPPEIRSCLPYRNNLTFLGLADNFSLHWLYPVVGNISPARAEFDAFPHIAAACTSGRQLKLQKGGKAPNEIGEILR